MRTPFDRGLLSLLLALAFLALSLNACDRWPWEQPDPTAPSVIVEATQTVTIGTGVAPSPAPSASPSVGGGLVKPNSVRVGFFGGSCPSGSGRVFPNNGAAQVPLTCTGFATATPKRADGTDQSPAEHGSGITWELEGGQPYVDVTAYRVIRAKSDHVTMWGKASVQEAFNRDVRGVAPGAFSLCATVQGVKGCLNGTVTP